MKEEFIKIFLVSFASGVFAGLWVCTYLEGEGLGILGIISILLWIVSVRLCERYGDR